MRFSPSSPWPEHGGFATDMEARPCHCFCAWKNTGFHVNHVSAVLLEYAGTVILKFRQEGRFLLQVCVHFWTHFWFPDVCPPSGGKSFGGSVSGPYMAPNSGLGVVPVQGRVCVMASSIEYPAFWVVDREVCICRIHRSPIPDGGGGMFWVLMVVAGCGRDSIGFPLSRVHKSA